LRRHLPWLSVLLVACAVFLTALRQGDLEGDGRIYAWFGYRVSATRQWLDLYFDWEGKLPYFNKPPLQFWLSALVYRFTGPTVLGARLVPAMFYVAAALVFYRVVRVQYPRWVAASAAMIFCLQREVAMNVMEARMDAGMILAFLVVSYAAAVLLQGTGGGGGGGGGDPAASRRAKWAKWAGFLTIGAAVGTAALARGGAAFLVFPVLAVVFAMARRWDLLRPGGPMVGMVLTLLAIVAPWYVRAYLVWGERFTSAIKFDAVEQHLEAFGRPWRDILFYYFRRVPESCALWLVPAVAGATALWVHCRRRGAAQGTPRDAEGGAERPLVADGEGGAERPLVPDGGGGAERPLVRLRPLRRRRLGPVDLLAVGWIVVWFVLIQFSTKRSVRYALPMFPWLSFLAAVGLFWLAGPRRVWRRWVLPYVGVVAVAVSAVLGGLDVPLYRPREAELLRVAPIIRAAVNRAREVKPGASRPTVFLVEGPEWTDADSQKRCVIQFYTGCRTETVAVGGLASVPPESYVAVFIGRPLHEGEADRTRAVADVRRDAVLLDAGKRFMIYQIP
jgi:4-amino-4-deoxy-L-arabinose transferase-like glycosyltransferase